MKLYNNVINMIEEKQLYTIERDIEKIAVEWEDLLHELTSNEKALYEWKTLYNAKSEEIIKNTNFQELYGKNNDKVRKEHVKNELSDWYNTIKELEFTIDYQTRRISFLKAMTYVKMGSVDI